MTKQQIFPSILILLDIAAAVGYIGDIRKVGYWIAAAVLTACVTY